MAYWDCLQTQTCHMMSPKLTFPRLASHYNIVQAPCMVADSYEVYVIALRPALFPTKFKNVAVLGDLPKLLIGLLDLCQRLRVYVFVRH